MQEKRSAEERRKRNLKQLEDMCLMDDLFMSKCFEGDLECMQLVLRIVLEMPDLRVVRVRTQQTLVSLTKKTVRLDIVAVDSSGRVYNIEVQREDGGAGRKRARYHSSKMDVELLEKGGDFDDLPETYVIFITERDVMGKGWAVYRVERRIQGADESFADGSHIVYVNGAYRDDSPIGKLMEDFACTDPAKMHYEELARRARFFKEHQRGVAVMCKAMQENYEEGIVEGRTGAFTEVAIEMLQEGSNSLEKIARFSKMTLSQVVELKESLEKGR